MTDKWKSNKQAPIPMRGPDGTMQLGVLTIVNEKNFYELMMRHMIGGVITEVGQDEDGFLWFEFDRDGEVFRCEVSQDEEGNGPGFLFGLPCPYKLYATKEANDA